MIDRTDDWDFRHAKSHVILKQPDGSFKSMKRESIAETTLNKQIKNIQAQEDAYQQQINEIKAKKDAMFDLRQSLEHEVSRLHAQRIINSHANKPKD